MMKEPDTSMDRRFQMRTTASSEAIRWGNVKDTEGNGMSKGWRGGQEARLHVTTLY